MRFDGPNILYYGALHFSPEHLQSLDLIQRQVATDLADSGLTYQDLIGKKILIDFRAEGQCDKIAATFIGFLKSLPLQDILVVYNSVVDTSTLTYRAVSIPEHLVNHQGWFDLIEGISMSDRIDTKFICLIRRPSPSRARFASALINLPSVRLSFGSDSYASELGAYRRYFADVDLPLLIDGYTKRSINNLEHDQRNPLFHSSAFNIVVESGSQDDHNVWHSLFISEKTFKAFGLRHIPIWFAVPRLVEQVRKLGFDLFDDVVDHSYDSVDDQTMRQECVVNEIKRLDTRYDLSQCQHLRRKFSARLDHNYNMLRSLRKISSKRFDIIMKEYGSI